MPSDGENKTVWNVSGRFSTGSGLYARGQVGTSFRLPDAYELYVIDPCCETGNPNLVGESSFNTELGFGYERGMFSAEVMGFYRKVDDLIGVTYDLPEYPDGFLINTPDAVKVWGGEVVVNARLSDVFNVTADYTHTRAEQVGTDDQLVNIPKDQVKLILQAQEPGGRFGGTVALNYVGNVWSNVAAAGRIEHGNYAIVDVSAWGYLDTAQRHRLGLRLENALDADYDTRMTRVREDITDVSYAAGFRGTPMTLHATYSLSL
jgi:vitamin B12 transporter